MGKDLCDDPLPAFKAVCWQRQHQHHKLFSVMMGCMILLGVFALSVSRGWRTVLITEVQLRQQGTIVLSKTFELLVFRGSSEVLQSQENNMEMEINSQGLDSSLIY